MDIDDISMYNSALMATMLKCFSVVKKYNGSFVVVINDKSKIDKILDYLDIKEEFDFISTREKAISFIRSRN